MNVLAKEKRVRPSSDKWSGRRNKANLNRDRKPSQQFKYGDILLPLLNSEDAYPLCA